MRRLLLFLLVAAAVGALAITSDTTYSRAPQSQPEYMALGDSLGVGVGASDPATTGYVPLFRDFLESDEGLDSDLFLNNLSISGATSGSLITQQLSAAVAELEDRNGDKNDQNDVAVVTVDIGGNDVLPLIGVCGGGVTAECAAAISATFATFSANFDFILGELRTAAGPDTPIIVMNYYNSLVATGCPLNALAPLGDIVLEGAPPLLPLGLNDLIAAIAAPHGAAVAETFGRLSPNDIQPDCVHANDDGHEIIADQFKDAFKDD